MVSAFSSLIVCIAGADVEVHVGPPPRMLNPEAVRDGELSRWRARGGDELYSSGVGFGFLHWWGPSAMNMWPLLVG